MEQRKRLPTGTFKLPTAEELKQRLEASSQRQRTSTSETAVGRPRHFTGEHAVVRAAPPPAPGQRPVLDALGNVGEVLSSQVEHQHKVETALVQLAQRLIQLERAVAKSAIAHTAQAQQTVDAVRQCNLVTEQTNECMRLVYDRLCEVANSLEGATRAYRHTVVLRQQAAKSWLVRAVYTVLRHRDAAAVGMFAFGVCFAAYGVVAALTR